MATILIATGDQKFSRAIANTLLHYGHEAGTARTGEETLQLLTSLQPSVVLLDLAILGMPGFTVLAKLRAQCPDVPIIVMASDITLETEERARELGAVDIFHKRLRMDVIMHMVRHAFKHVERSGNAAFTAAKPVKPATILIVDDEPEIREMVGEFLQRRGYRTKIAASGEEALKMIAQDPPDLVLLDIYMPGMNGVEVLRELMRQKSPVGVIMLTASQEEPLLKTALDLGAFDVLSKPVDLNQVELAVMVKLLLSEQDDSPVLSK